MKKISLLFFITIISISSCSEEGENNIQTNSESSSGSWTKFMGDNGNTGYSDSKISKSNPKSSTIYMPLIPFEYPVYHEGSLIVTSDGCCGYVDKLHSIDVNSGTENWRITCYSSVVPTISNNSIFISGVVGEDAEFSSTKYFYAIDINSGNVKWKFKLEDSDGSNAAVSDGLVIFTGWHDIYALDADTGQVIWIFSLEYASMSSPAIVNNVVYAGVNYYNSTATPRSEYSIVAIDLFTGIKKWETKVDAAIHSAPIVTEGKVIIKEFGSNDSRLLAFDALTGGRI